MTSISSVYSKTICQYNVPFDLVPGLIHMCGSAFQDSKCISAMATQTRLQQSETADFLPYKAQNMIAILTLFSRPILGPQIYFKYKLWIL